MGLKSLIQDRIVNPASRINVTTKTLGIVLNSDDSNNTCKVKYVNKNGESCNKDNVTVRLYGKGTDWFPAKNDIVVIEDSGDTIVVVARYVGNYAMDVRSKRKLKKDIMSDSSGCQPPGGSII